MTEVAITPILDRIYLRILSTLQVSARITTTKLSSQVFLSAPACTRRIRALEEAGVVRGYRAVLDAKLLGFDVDAIVLVSLNTQTYNAIRSFESQVGIWPQVRECYALNGEVDFLLRCQVESISQFQSFVTDVLIVSPNIKNVRTFPIMRHSVSKSGVPMELLGVE